MIWFNQSSPGTRAALAYITIGALTTIWSGVWYAYMSNHPPSSDAPYYLCAGMAVTGLAVLVIGIAVGAIGRSARQADHSPKEAAPVVVQPPPGTIAPPAVVPPTAPVSTEPLTEAPSERFVVRR